MILAILMGFGAGAVSGLLGVGGGILFVPALTLVLSLSQVKAESTSLLAIIPVALLGAWRQARYGNVRLSDGLAIGGLSVAGVVGGTALANVLPERALKLAFAALMLAVAGRLLQRRWRSRRQADGQYD